MTINSDTMGIKNSNNITRQKKEMDNNLQKLSSGKRINVAADDVAAMSLSNGFNAKIRSLQQAKRNADDALSFMQCSEGYLQTVQNNLTRMLELSIQAATETLTEADRGFICVEFQKILEGNEHIIASARFGSVHLLDGGAGNLEFQIGGENTPYDRFVVVMDQYAVDPAKIRPPGLIDTKQNAQAAVEALQGSLDYLTGIRANLGAAQNRLTATSANLSNDILNKQEANSRLQDTDFAEQSTKYVKNKIINQSATAVLGQANQNLKKAGKLL
ncbi:MAG: flagellin FliC [Oligoflexia bacterium]|nr:flagellin FliC [Oligoflexia bacterium]